jgi:hypothetical protein
VGLAVCLGLAFTPLGCGSSQEAGFEPIHLRGGSDGWSAPKYTVDRLTECANAGASRMTDRLYAIYLDADVRENGRVSRATVRESMLDDQGIESCMVGVLEAMLVPRYLMKGLIASHPVSPQSRGAVGNVVVLGAAVNLVPVVIVAAGVTFVVVVTLHVAEEVAEARKRRRKVEKECDELLVQCLENPWQPEWNRSRFGNRKACEFCHGECINDEKWPDYKCPPPDYRPN